MAGTGLGDVFEDLGAEDGIKGGVGLGDGGDVGDDVELAVVPGGRVHGSRIVLGLILREVLGNVTEVGAEAAELLFAGAGIKNAPAGGEGGKGFFEPCDANRFVGGADGEGEQGDRGGGGHFSLRNQKHPQA